MVAMLAYFLDDRSLAQGDKERALSHDVIASGLILNFYPLPSGEPGRLPNFPSSAPYKKKTFSFFSKTTDAENEAQSIQMNPKFPGQVGVEMANIQHSF